MKDRVRHVVQRAFGGKGMVIFSGGIFFHGCVSPLSSAATFFRRRSKRSVFL